MSAGKPPGSNTGKQGGIYQEIASADAHSSTTRLALNASRFLLY
jgi:hypothetical protein